MSEVPLERRLLILNVDDRHDLSETINRHLCRLLPLGLLLEGVEDHIIQVSHRLLVIHHHIDLEHVLVDLDLGLGLVLIPRDDVRVRWERKEGGVLLKRRGSQV